MKTNWLTLRVLLVALLGLLITGSRLQANADIVYSTTVDAYPSDGATVTNPVSGSAYSYFSISGAAPGQHFGPFTFRTTVYRDGGSGVGIQEIYYFEGIDCSMGGYASGSGYVSVSWGTLSVNWHTSTGTASWFGGSQFDGNQFFVQM